MVLNDWIAEHGPDDVIYLGCECEKTESKINGSGFVFIGRAKDAPVEVFGKRYVLRTYPHETDYPGMTIIIYGDEHGKFWMWNECDPSVPLRDDLYCENDSSYENVLMAVARQTIADYKALIYKTIRDTDPTDISEINDIIRSSRKTADLDFLKSSGVGDYLIRSVEDEIRIEFLYPKIRKWPYEKRYDFIKKKKKEMLRERVKKNEKAAYATIKGRSVYHAADG